MIASLMLVASVAARPCESRLQGASERTSACVICGARSLALAISVSEGTPTQPRPHNLGSSLRCVSCSFSERNTEPRALVSHDGAAQGGHSVRMLQLKMRRAT